MSDEVKYSEQEIPEGTTSRVLLEIKAIKEQQKLAGTPEPEVAPEASHGGTEGENTEPEGTPEPAAKKKGGKK